MMQKYQVIYADPPWQYRNRKIRGGAEHHYRTLSIEELCSLKVAEIADEDAALFLWCTFPMIPEALRLISAWGFQYKTVAFVWVKQNPVAKTWFYGMGFWTRSNAEICILATKGHPKRAAKDIHQLIISPVKRHSQKPEEVRERIVKLLGDVPRIELFARERTEGWHVWGDEIDSDIQIMG